MLVKLPRNCSGREIVEAFKVASTFEEKPGKKWEPKDLVDKIIYVPGSVKQVARDIGVCVHSFSLKKKWGLFGKKVWKLNHSPNFTLDPLDISQLYYRQIEVTIERKDVFGEENICTDLSNSRYEEVRLVFERIIGNLYANL